MHASFIFWSSACVECGRCTAICATMTLLQLVLLSSLMGYVKSLIYEVGPSKVCSTIGSVPLNSLSPGDQVLVHAKPTPCFEKFAINSEGTAQAPITIRGIPDANGDLPIIDGNGAVTPLNQDYWNEVRNLIKIGGSSTPSTPNGPTYIRIENFLLRNAHSGFSLCSLQNHWGSRGRHS